MPKILIMFPAGSGGNFLANWLTPDDDALMQPNYKIDAVENTNRYRRALFLGEGYGVQPWVGLGGTVNDLTKLDRDSIYWQEFLNQIREIKQAKKPILITHVTDEAVIKSYLDDVETCITIWPYTNEFGYIRSIINKNILFNMDQSQKDGLRFEDVLDIVKVQYRLWLDKEDPLENSKIIDYGNLTDIGYLIELYQNIIGEPPSVARMRWAKQYIAVQNKPIRDTNSKNYKRLREEIDPRSLIDLGILTFMYEMNNPELKRIWSIDDVPRDFDSAADFLYANRNNYY
jgi:hypothetical protein